MGLINQAVFLTALSAMAKVFLVCASGYFAAKIPKKSPLLPVSLLSQLSRLMNYIFLPCLMLSSIGSVLTVEMLVEFVPVLVGSFLIVPMAYCFSHALRLLFCLPLDPLTQKLVMATTFPNMVSLPLLLMETLCEQPLVHEDFDDGEEECYTVASAMITVYSVGWHLLFWSWGYYALQGLGNTQKTSTSGETEMKIEQEGGSEEQGVGHCFHNKHSSQDGDRPGSEKSLKSLLGTSKVKARVDTTDGLSLAQKIKNKVRQLALQPTMVSIYLGFLVGLTPLQDLLFKDPSSPLSFLGSAIASLATPPVVLATMVMAGNLATIDLSQFRQKKQSDSAPTVVMPSKRQFAYFLFCRLVAFPAFACVLLLGFIGKHVSIIKENNLIQLVLVIQTAVPSANMVIICLSLFQQQSVAAGVSYLYVYQYLFSILSLTIVISLAMSFIYDV